jgi:hypothetical protein
LLNIIIPVLIAVNSITSPIITSNVINIEPKPKEAIERHFKGTEASIMRAIAHCESGTRQYDEGNKPLKSKLGTDDVGIFQIHIPIWEKEAIKLGYDINTVEGNVLMAKHILNTQGHSAWKPSRDCWSKLIGDI